MASARAVAGYFNVNYNNDQEKAQAFMDKFLAKSTEGDAEMELDAPTHLTGMAHLPKYKKQITEVVEGKSDSIVVDLDDVANCEDVDDVMLNHILTNTKSYIAVFEKAIDQLFPEYYGSINEESDPLDVLLYQRRQISLLRQDPVEQPPTLDENGTQNQIAQEPRIMQNQVPPELMRKYTVFFKPPTGENNREVALKPVAVREVRAAQLGHLVTVRGIVTRVSNVKPMMKVATYSCDQCANETFVEVTKASFTPLGQCPSQDCRDNRVRGNLVLQTRACKFIRFQEVKIQEMTDQVPTGHIPRTMTIHLHEGLVRSCHPGDTVDVTGIYLPTPSVGGWMQRGTLLTDTYLMGQYVSQLKKQYQDMVMTPEIRQQIESLASREDLYGSLAKSISPNIYGHDDVKKALLLLLVGGVNKETGDGMKIRGELNICLMGDPGVAKSQLLKYIARIAPRGVYTTGKGSSGVGLTAAVTRDPITSEMVLEAGSLVLADNGICCIDEFDKMDEADRTAIHEVMEQQTISISKAGITTTLNARTSILAAANPAFGRYNTRLKPTHNINLPAALLSRFDLLFLILDRPDADDDLRLAQHVCHVHETSEAPQVDGASELIEGTLMRFYIAEARKWRPTIPKSVADYVVNAYVNMRNSEDNAIQRELQYTSARTLLSIIRLATALARLRFAAQVEEGDVDEALRLIEVSKASLIDGPSKKEDKDMSSRIYKLVCEKAKRAGGGKLVSVRYSDLVDFIRAKGYTEQQLDRTMDQYQYLNIIMRTGPTITWVGAEDADIVEEEY